MTRHRRQTPVLPCPDILVEILSHLDPGRYSLHETKQARKTRLACRRALRASALTCHTLSNLALDVLWRASVDGLRPLIYLLPMHGRHVPNVVRAVFRQYIKLLLMGMR